MNNLLKNSLWSLQIIPNKQCLRLFQSAVINSYDKNIEIHEMKDIYPKDDEIILKVETAGVNYMDIQMIKGAHFTQQKLPFVPGYELCGTIHSIGKNISKWKKGDRILGLKCNGTGAFAEYCSMNVKKDFIVSLPYSISSDLAASIPVAYGTSYTGLKRLASERRGNSFLILTSRGTLGLAAMDLAQTIFEGVVFGASDTEKKLEYLRDEGKVFSTLNWTDGKLEKNIYKQTFEKGVDYVIDTVGGDVFQQGLKCLKIDGHMVSLAFSSAQIPKLNVLHLHQKNITVSGVWLAGREREEITENLITILEMFDQDFLKGIIKINKFPLKDVKKCLEEIQSTENFGKYILTMY